MASDMWVVLVIAFMFCAWVFYNMVLDVSGRETEYGGLGNCVEGCIVTPPGLD